MLAIFCFSNFISNEGGLQSALLSLRFPVTLQGTNLFQGNTGGAVTLLQTHLDVFGTVIFEDNVAVDGGAIKLLDQSMVCFY